MSKKNNIKALLILVCCLAICIFTYGYFRETSPDMTENVDGGKTISGSSDINTGDQIETELEIEGESGMDNTIEEKLIKFEDINEITTDNYKIVQKLYKKYDNIKEKNNSISEDLKVKIEDLNKKAIDFEEKLNNNAADNTVITVFFEKAHEFKAISAEGTVNKGIQFDKVELLVNGKQYEASITNQSFSVSRKLILGEKPSDATVNIYYKDQVVETVSCNVVEI